MTASRMASLDKHLSTVAVPVLALLIIAATLSFYTLRIDPGLQQIAPVETWPLTARALHWMSPWFAAGAGLTAAALLLGGLDGVWLCYFTHRRTVVGLLVWALIVLGLTTWANLPLALQLLGGKI